MLQCAVKYTSRGESQTSTWTFCALSMTFGATWSQNNNSMSESEPFHKRWVRNCWAWLSIDLSCGRHQLAASRTFLKRSGERAEELNSAGPSIIGFPLKMVTTLWRRITQFGMRQQSNWLILPLCTRKKDTSRLFQKVATCSFLWTTPQSQFRRMYFLPLYHCDTLRWTIARSFKLMWLTFSGKKSGNAKRSINSVRREQSFPETRRLNSNVRCLHLRIGIWDFICLKS